MKGQHIFFQFIAAAFKLVCLKMSHSHHYELPTLTAWKRLLIASATTINMIEFFFVIELHISEVKGDIQC